MTPEEAEGFYEEDEDPAEVFARFDAAGPHCVTAPPYDAGGHRRPGWTRARNGTGADEQIRQGLDYIRSTYGGGDAR